MNDNTNLARHQEGTPERVKQRMTVAPLVDVYENQDELLLLADVPGATKDGINVHLDKGQLTIEARRPDETTGSPVAAEHRPCDYFRVFSVPQGIDASKIDAQLNQGVRRLRLPKAEAVKPRRIEVKTG
jgi:HSP20 family protein